MRKFDRETARNAVEIERSEANPGLARHAIRIPQPLIRDSLTPTCICVSILGMHPPAFLFAGILVCSPIAQAAMPFPTGGAVVQMAVAQLPAMPGSRDQGKRGLPGPSSSAEFDVSVIPEPSSTLGLGVLFLAAAFLRRRIPA